MRYTFSLLTCLVILSGLLSGCSSTQSGTAIPPSPEPSPKHDEIINLSGNEESSLILTHSGQLFSAGRSIEGVLGLGIDDTDYPSFTAVSIDLYGMPVHMSTIKTVYSVASRDRTSLSVSHHGLLFGTGINHQGQIGFGLLTDILAHYTPIPIETATGTPVILHNAQGSNAFSVALDSHGQLWATGQRSLGPITYNPYGDNIQVGSTAAELNHWTPITVHDGQNIVSFQEIGTAVLSGYYIDLTGQLWVAGDNEACQLDVDNCDPGRQRIPSITRSDFTGHVAHIYPAFNTAALIDTHGNLWVIGDNREGYIGGGLALTLPHFTKLTIYTERGLLVTFKEASLSGKAIVALSSDGHVYVSGLNTDSPNPSYTVLGLPEHTVSVNTLTLLNLQEQGHDVVIEHVHTTATHTLLSDKQGNLWVVGQNDHGQLGTGNKNNLKVFTKIAGPQQP